MRSLYLLTLLLIGNAAASDEWGGCSVAEGKSSVVKRKKTTPVCLTVGGDEDWGTGVDYKRFSFAPKADEYSRFTIQGSYQSLVRMSQNNKDVTVFASSQTSLSFLRKYYDTKFGIFPHLTAIIDVHKGQVQGIAWDNACVFCADERCAENTYGFDAQGARLGEPTKGCYLTKNECDEIQAQGGNECDLTLYVVWTGTDVNGSYLTSSSNRFSAFNPKQVKDQMRDGIKDLVPDIDWPWL
eukprot:CAMPEP_0197246124 /NCGR_PEP_ID=MMETSP1429-20130617/10680_1 /TAXON_ID=49237 /ORGANISM="Chaetoceros  sp., Strain UNC1202" /LENGTH=239 /DNA_ID=CAMNT_0042706729 /DNA_START=18 /DNA_END=737 /DNA_ORIENTATION=+